MLLQALYDGIGEKRRGKEKGKTFLVAVAPPLGWTQNPFLPPSAYGVEVVYG
jgi:hypothetical protein